MALYRTERRLSWNHKLRIGHWYAPWSQAEADTGADYFSRTLRWLRHTYPKATVAADSHALPDINASWPQERFGLPLASSTAAAARRVAATADETQEAQMLEATDAHTHAGDLLLIEWPQPGGSNSATATEKATNTPEENDNTTAAGSPISTDALPPLWTNGLERALRRAWQDNPSCEVIFIGGTASICKQGMALAEHYGITVLNPMALLKPDSPDAIDHRSMLFHEAKPSAPASLTPQGQEIWAGMLISLLREQVRFGPTPDPVSLPSGLWSRGT